MFLPLSLLILIQFCLTLQDSFCQNGLYHSRTQTCFCFVGFDGPSCNETTYCLFGRLKNDTCQCVTGWEGEKCDEKTLCLHGTVRNDTDSEQCHCHTGYYGENCDIPVCDQGVTHGSDICYCLPGWRGEFCDEPICEFGLLRPDNKSCQCHERYLGSRCQLPNCVHGHPLGGECLCSQGWEGKFCDLIWCHYGSRTNNGSECDCHVPYVGKNCRRKCQNGKVEDKKCICADGWTGTYCTRHQEIFTRRVAYHIWLPVAAAVLLVLVAVLIIFCICRARQTTAERNAQILPMNQLPKLPTYEEAIQRQPPSYSWNERRN